MSRTPRGQALLGFLLLIALGVVTVAALTLRSGLALLPLLWLLGGLAVAMAVGVAMARRDRVGLLQLLLFCTVMPALLGGMWAFFASGPQPVALRVCGTGALLAVGCGGLLRRELTRPEQLPNLLLHLAKPEQILELDGVQLCAGLAPGPAGAFELQVALQSCVGGARTVRLRLEPALPQQLAHPPHVEARLGPAEVGLLRIPVFLCAGTREPLRLYLHPRVEGPPAPRLRHWRARAFQDRIAPLDQVLLASTGTFVSTAGWFVELPAVPEAAPAPGALPTPSWEALRVPAGEPAEGAARRR